jgi:hypothetical protein
MSIITRIKQRFRLFAMNKPWLFFPLYNLVEKNKRLSFKDKTEFVIEGYPRSGNTFAVVAFQKAQSHDIPIAHHLHAAAQIIRGVEKDLPVPVLLRDPDDAVISLKIRHPDLDLKVSCLDYIAFYKAVLPRKDKVVIGLFEDVPSDYGKVIAELNKKFGTEYGIFQHDESAKDAVFEDIKGIQGDNSRKNLEISIPTTSKDALKAKVRREYEEQVPQALRDEARRLYTTLGGGKTA